MSWDFGMKVDTGGPEPIDLDYWKNYTYNVSPMFYDALRELTGGIREINNMQADKALPFLQRGLNRMQQNPETYQAMNPENGWGNYEGACEVLQTLITWALDNPKATFTVR